MNTISSNESTEETIEGLLNLINQGQQSVYLDLAIAKLRELLALRKAREAAVPVAFTDKRNLSYINEKGRETAMMWGAQNNEAGDVALYAAPPAQPVAVPDELLSAMEEVLRISDRDHEAWHRVRDGIASCRAAMLKQLSGDSGLLDFRS